MPCLHCKALNTTAANFAGLQAPGPLASEDLPVKLHPAALRNRVPTVPAFMRSTRDPPEHTGPEWQLRWDDPKICGGCGCWFSDSLPPRQPPEQGGG